MLLAFYGIGVALSQSLMSTMGIVFVVLALLQLRHFRDAPAPTKVLALLALSWILFSGLNVVLRPWDSRSSDALRAIPLLLVPLGLVLSPNKVSLKWPVLLCALSLIVSLGMGFYQFLIVGTPAYGFLRNPIYYAYNLLPACLFFAELFVRKISYGRLTYPLSALLSFLCFLGILASVTRMPLTCVLGYYALRIAPHLKSRNVGRAWVIALLMFGGLGFSAYRLSPIIQEKVNRSFSVEDPSRHWRLQAWKYNWNLFLENPLLGTGMEKNGIDVERMPEMRGHWKEGHLYFAHSIYFQSLADSGALGSLLFFGFWIYLGFLFPALRPFLITIGIAGLTENIFNNSKAAHSLYFYTLLFLTCLKNVATKEPS